jgi:hypothetical protein
MTKEIPIKPHKKNSIFYFLILGLLPLVLVFQNFSSVTSESFQDSQFFQGVSSQGTSSFQDHQDIYSIDAIQNLQKVPGSYSIQNLQKVQDFQGIQGWEILENSSLLIYSEPSFSSSARIVYPLGSSSHFQKEKNREYGKESFLSKPMEENSLEEFQNLQSFQNLENLQNFQKLQKLLLENPATQCSLQDRTSFLLKIDPTVFNERGSDTLYRVTIRNTSQSLVDFHHDFKKPFYSPHCKEFLKELDPFSIKVCLDLQTQFSQDSYYHIWIRDVVTAEVLFYHFFVSDLWCDVKEYPFTGVVSLPRKEKEKEYE